MATATAFHTTGLDGTFFVLAALAGRVRAVSYRDKCPIWPLW
jgi:hypothetical protein